jgi:exopolysaccharide biosynthesis polyprenyl glycosylphosphotransferase
MLGEAVVSRAGLSMGERRALLFLGDAVCVAGAILLSLITWMALDGMLSNSVVFLLSRDLTPFYWLTPLWFFLIANFYDPHVAFNRERTISGLAIASSLSFIPYLFLYFVTTPGTLPRLAILLFLVAVALFELVWRMIAILLFALPAFQRPVIILGAGRAGQAILKVLLHDAPGHFRVAGFVDDDPQKRGECIENICVLGNGAALQQVVARERATTIILAITGEIQSLTAQSLIACQEQGIEVMRMSRLYEELLGRVPIQHLKADWLVSSFLDSARLYDLYGPLKRLLDMIGGAVGLLATVVLLPFVAAFIRIDTPGPIFYFQERAGRGGNPFRILKYRTMVQNAEADGKARWASAEDPRITRVGKWLRRTRLDELPQFWNVLRGDISLVGPRAERPEINAELEKQVPFYRARLLVRPGLTGWSQVNFGYVRTVEDTATKLEFDLYYIRHRSLWLDIKIVLRTLWTVLRMQGA